MNDSDEGVLYISNPTLVVRKEWRRRLCWIPDYYVPDHNHRFWGIMIFPKPEVYLCYAVLERKKWSKKKFDYWISIDGSIV